jgi:hypothetical protein
MEEIDTISTEWKTRKLMHRQALLENNTSAIKLNRLEAVRHYGWFTFKPKYTHPPTLGKPSPDVGRNWTKGEFDEGRCMFGLMMIRQMK